MKITSPAFKENAARALGDGDLRQALGALEENFAGRRAQAVAKLPEFDRLRDQARDIKDHVIANLDFYLERFEETVLGQGGQVHWCETPDEARRTILELCRAAGARTVTKGKSMIAEEIGLNEFLETNGIEPVETDLGEYIIQLAGEPPSHIIAPAVHKTKEQIGALFFEHHQKYGKTERLVEASEMVAEGRELLRQRFLDADVGITGANFLVAETGSAVIVTNEGNADLTRTLPRMHVVTASIDKLVPTLEDATTLLRVLARSATGQEFSVYTTFASGPRAAGERDGPAEFHVVLVDNGRSELLGTEFQDILRCIRCGACLNHCPVYAAVGGHAYGWVYSGPMGAVLTPALQGIERAHHLPSASSFCGRCEEVCPMRIPLPKLMRHWRERAYAKALGPGVERAGVRAWTFLARRPALYRLALGLAARLLHVLARGRGRIRRLPGAAAWTAGRDLPAPQGATFQHMWRAAGGSRR